MGFLVALCVVAIALATAGSFALRTASRIWLRHLLESQPAGSVLADQYLSRPQRLHAAAGGATALAAFALGAAAATSGGAVAAAAWLVGGFTVMCVLGVAVARGLARRFPTRVVPVTLPVLRAADVVVAPVRVLAERMVGGRRPAVALPAPAPDDAARADLDDLLREGQLEGVGEEAELAIISGVVHFGDKCASDVMTPNARVLALDADAPAPLLARAIADSGYSRIPVYRGARDNIVGVVLAFEVLQTAGETAPRVHPIFAATPDLACTDLLARMLRARLHMAVVGDAPGVMLGVVTLDDLLEELVGDIRDEHDEPAPGDPEAVEGPAVAR